MRNWSALDAPDELEEPVPCDGCGRWVELQKTYSCDTCRHLVCRRCLTEGECRRCREYAGHEDGVAEYEIPHGSFVAVRQDTTKKWHAAAVPARSATLCGRTIGPHAHPTIRFVPAADLCARCRKAMDPAWGDVP